MAKKYAVSLRESNHCVSQETFEQQSIAHLVCHWDTPESLKREFSYTLERVERCANCIKGVRTGCKIEHVLTPDIRSTYFRILKELENGERTPLKVHDELQGLLEKGNLSAGRLMERKFYEVSGFPKQWFKKWLVRAGRWPEY